MQPVRSATLSSPEAGEQLIEALPSHSTINVQHPDLADWPGLGFPSKRAGLALPPASDLLKVCGRVMVAADRQWLFCAGALPSNRGRPEFRIERRRPQQHCCCL